MPIPPFTIDGVLPPFIGPDGPGGSSENMSPYAVTAVEVVTTLGGTDEREGILRKWLKHRAALRELGIVRGFQWLDGSFVEDKAPRDLDVVTFFHQPSSIESRDELTKLLEDNSYVFERRQVKKAYNLDFFPIGLDERIETIVNVAAYYLNLFSHRRGDFVWKGILQVSLENVADDTAALAALGPDPSEPTAGETPL